MDELILYIRNLISNCQVQYDRELGEIEDDIKNIFIEEIKTIVKNFNTVMCTYFTKKLDSLISLDLSTSWYSSEKSILDNNINELNPYMQNKTIRKILTIICKSVDFLNDFNLNQISKTEQQVEYLKRKLKEEEEKVSVSEFNFMTNHFNILIEKDKVYTLTNIKILKVYILYYIHELSLNS